MGLEEQETEWAKLQGMRRSPPARKGWEGTEEDKFKVMEV